MRYYFLVSREGTKAAKIFINVITRIKLIFGDGGIYDWQVRTYGPCVLNYANFQQVNFQLMKDTRAVRPYQSSGTTAWESVESVDY